MKQLPTIEWCRENCSDLAAQCAYRAGGRLYHTIRDGADWKDCWRIVATNFTGCGEVEIYTPKNPTQDEIDETIDFLLGELDDHDALDEYERLIGR